MILETVDGVRHSLKTFPWPLVLTASVSPKGMSGLSVSECNVREDQYIDTLRFYIDSNTTSHIVFAENSGWDLSRLQDAVSGRNTVLIEWLSYNLNDYPRDLGKSYGELCLLDRVIKESLFVRKAKCFIKVTGRFPVRNIRHLLAEAERRQPWVIFCDMKEHQCYDVLLRPELDKRRTSVSMNRRKAESHGRAAA